MQDFPSIYNEAPCGPAAVVARQSKPTPPGTGFEPCPTSWLSRAPAANHLFQRSTRAQQTASLDISYVNYVIWLLSHNRAVATNNMVKLPVEIRTRRQRTTLHWTSANDENWQEACVFVITLCLSPATHFVSHNLWTSPPVSNTGNSK